MGRARLDERERSQTLGKKLNNDAALTGQMALCVLYC